MAKPVLELRGPACCWRWRSASTARPAGCPPAWISVCTTGDRNCPAAMRACSRCATERRGRRSTARPSSRTPSRSRNSKRTTPRERSTSSSTTRGAPADRLLPPGDVARLSSTFPLFTPEDRGTVASRAQGGAVVASRPCGALYVADRAPRCPPATRGGRGCFCCCDVAPAACETIALPRGRARRMAGSMLRPSGMECARGRESSSVCRAGISASPPPRRPARRPVVLGPLGHHRSRHPSRGLSSRA